ncbi:DUF4296 domain-containing protein [Winogradskyella sp. PG-2]|uniref:DUF4296 domain-containing protein n=1 Tax=Winogradskyella sp. PG-2 TaxID=754409 RepID=UPI00045860E6|nr:DUF4296 domain-containing protein [Winogradskyella sp. PG-2]BAO75905.1 hypothetical protein WPG_1675 [Winogradskyella sp. PG-2]
MIKNIRVIIVLCLLVFACNKDDKPKRPDNLIPKDKMSNILHDLYIINGAKGVNRKLLEANGFMPETYLLTKYNIDSIQFADSNAYYAFNTEEYKSIVSEAKARLEKEKVEFEELQKIEGQAAKIKRDSISRINKRKNDSINKINKRKKDSIKKSIDSLYVTKN